MKKEHIEAAGHFLSTYYNDLNYIRNFQRFKKGDISETDFVRKEIGTFYSFLIEFKVARNFSQGTADKLLQETTNWVNGKYPDNVDLFAEKLSQTDLTRGNVVTSMASKILFLNNPCSIIPMDMLARKALNQKQNNYAMYLANVETYRKKNKQVIDKFLMATNSLTSIIDAEFTNEVKGLQDIKVNRAIDKLLWTSGQ